MTPVFRWHRETKLQPGDRVPAWYLLEHSTEITHVRVQWVHPKHQTPGWYVVICNPPEIGRYTLPDGHDRIDEAKKAARRWWAANREKHLRQF